MDYNRVYNLLLSTDLIQSGSICESFLFSQRSVSRLDQTTHKQSNLGRVLAHLSDFLTSPVTVPISGSWVTNSTSVLLGRSLPFLFFPQASWAQFFSPYIRVQVLQSLDQSCCFRLYRHLWLCRWAWRTGRHSVIKMWPYPLIVEYTKDPLINARTVKFLRIGAISPNDLLRAVCT